MNSGTKLFIGLMSLAGTVAVGITLFMSLRGRRPRAHSDLGGQSTSGTGSFPSPENSESGLKTDENNQQNLTSDSLGSGVSLDANPLSRSRKSRTKGSFKPSVTPAQTEGDDTTAQVQLTDEDDDYMDNASFHKLPPLDNPEENREPKGTNKGGEPQSLSLVSGTLADTGSSAGQATKVAKYHLEIGKGEKVDIELPYGTRVKQLREKLQRTYGASTVGNVKVLLAGKELLDDIVLNELNPGDATLFVYVRSEEDILLLTAKALKVDQNDGDGEYEYEYEYEEDVPED